MKMRLGRKFALMLAVVLIMPIVILQSSTVANAAATPKFSKKSVTIVGQAKTYQLKIKNTVKGSKYKWSTSDKNIVNVTSKGLVTAVNKGIATIKCKITYPSRKTKLISCQVTVTIPVQTIKINNANEVNGAHKLLVGQSYKFICDITPVNTSDTVVWSAEGDSKDCVKVDADGTVTGIKAGKTILVATAGTGTAAIRDQKIIEVAQPTATVKSVDFVDSKTMKVVFDSPIDSSTVIGSNNKLLDNISLSLKRNTKNVMASDPGALKGTLSTDLLTLTITSTNMFNGDYSINFSSNIKTNSGLAIVEATKQISYSDSVGPSIESYNLDDSGFINNITFSEAVNITGLQVYLDTTSLVGTSVTAEGTKTYLTTASNYVLSEDKKTLSINLSKIISTDYGKTYKVTLYGVKDLAGNYSSPITMPVVLRTDNSARPQAQALSVTRTGYNTLTAVFDRAISFAGFAMVNGTQASGSVDANNNKKVNYTMPDTLAALTGAQSVILSSWNGYNVVTGAFAGNQTFAVDFTVNKTVPELLASAYDTDTGILTLTYNEDVNLTTKSGNFSASYNTSGGLIQPLTVPYTQITSTDSKVIKLKLYLSQLGNYTFTLNSGFVKDNFRNSSLVRTVNVGNADGTTTMLPGPYSITQSATNPSQIILEFTNMLNVSTAQLVSNYSIAGVTILAAQVTKNTPDTGATVVLTVADGTIDLTVARPIIINGIKDYNGAYAPISNYTSTVTLKQNKMVSLVSPIFDTTSKRSISLNFSDQIKGSMIVNVTQINVSTPIAYTSTVTVSGNCAYILLGSTPPSGAYLRVDILQNNITDVNGNAVTLSSPITVPVGY